MDFRIILILGFWDYFDLGIDIGEKILEHSKDFTGKNLEFPG